MNDVCTNPNCKTSDLKVVDLFEVECFSCGAKYNSEKGLVAMTDDGTTHKEQLSREVASKI